MSGGARWAGEDEHYLTRVFVDDGQKNTVADEIRKSLTNRARGANAKLGDPTLQAIFIAGASEACLYIMSNRDRKPQREGERVALTNRAHAIRDAAQKLIHELDRLSPIEPDDRPSDVEIFEGKLAGSGLVALSREACSRLVMRADCIDGTFTLPRGGQERGTDILGVQIMAHAWRDAFGLEPKAKGTFGGTVREIFSLLGWDDVTPNTLASWQDSQ